MAAKVTNNASTTLATPMSSTSGTLQVAAGDGAMFPVLLGGDWFYVTLTNAAVAFEVAKVTARSGDMLTLVRGVDNTVALPWSPGDRVSLNPCAALINEIMSASSVTEPYADAGGTVDVISAAITTNATNSVLYDGYRIALGSMGANTVVDPKLSLTINGVPNPAVAIVKFVGGARVPLHHSDTHVGIMDLRYDAPNAVWVLMNPRMGASSVTPYADATGTSDIITAAYESLAATPYDGMTAYLGVSSPNTTSAPTFAPLLVGVAMAAKPIVKYFNNARVPLLPGDIQGVAHLQYDSVNLVWILLNPSLGNLVSLTDARYPRSGADGLAGNLIVVSSSRALVQADSGKRIQCTAALTLVLPTPAAGLNYVVYMGANSVTLAMPSGMLTLPDGSTVSGSYGIPTSGVSAGGSIELWARSTTEWVLQNRSGRMIASPGVAGNEVVVVSQIPPAVVPPFKHFYVDNTVYTITLQNIPLKVMDANLLSLNFAKTTRIMVDFCVSGEFHQDAYFGIIRFGYAATSPTLHTIVMVRNNITTPNYDANHGSTPGSQTIRTLDTPPAGLWSWELVITASGTPGQLCTKNGAVIAGGTNYETGLQSSCLLLEV
jgi:hypothetical protein